MVPFREQHPSYQRRIRLWKRLGEIREQMGALGRAVEALWRRARALAIVASGEVAHAKENTTLWFTAAVEEAERWACELGLAGGRSGAEQGGRDEIREQMERGAG